jgi:acetoin utilization protein AcuB
MRVEELMRKRVETITEDGSAEQALKRMRAKKLRHLVVVRGREVVGIVSDRDIAGLLVGNLRIDRTIYQVMSRGVAVVSPQTPVEEAARMMRKRKIGSLPVVKDGALVGIVTVSDLLDLLTREIDRGATGKTRPSRPSPAPNPRRSS